MNKTFKSITFILTSLITLTGCNVARGDSSSSSSSSESKDTFSSEPTYIYNGETPVFSSDSKSLTYGLYPQNYISEPNLIESLNSLTKVESNGWYLYQNKYYAKIIATPYGKTYEFDNGDLIEANKQYWFSCEPIEWKILSISSGRYFIVSSKLLDTHDFYHSDVERTIEGKTIYPNNYEYSDIRNYLNNDFYNSAFNLNKQFVLSTSIDNSGPSTRYKNNPYACDNTNDNIFLLSYQDYVNKDYFPINTQDVARSTKTTEFARARGAQTIFNPNSIYHLCANYYTRSPIETYPNYVSYVYQAGSMGIVTIDKSHYCIRPALNIKVA